MNMQESRSALGPVASPDRWVAVLALLAAPLLLAVLLAGIGDNSVQPGKPATVTVGADAGGDRRSDAAALGGAAAAAAGETPGRRLAEGLVLAPRTIDGRLAGYVIGADSDRAVLSAAQLRAGDLLVDLDGRPLGPARVRALGDELSLGDAVEVTFLRDGQLRRRMIDLGR